MCGAVYVDALGVVYEWGGLFRRSGSSICVGWFI